MLVLTVAVSALAFTACGGGKGEDGSAVVAKVNGTAVTEDQLDCFAKISMQLLGYDPSDITEDQEQELLNQLVVIQVVKEYYKDKDDDIYGDDYESAANTFIDSAHESAADFLKQYEITAVSTRSARFLKKYRRNTRLTTCTLLHLSIMMLIRMNLRMRTVLTLNWMT